MAGIQPNPYLQKIFESLIAPIKQPEGTLATGEGLQFERIAPNLGESGVLDKL